MLYFAKWTEALTVDDALNVLEDLSLSHAFAGGRAGQDIAELIKLRDWPKLLAYQLDQSSAELNVLQLIDARQALAFYSKLPWLDIGADRETVALGKWYKSEAECAETNKFFLSMQTYKVKDQNASFHPAVFNIFEHARRLIHYVLGRCPSISELPLRFGPKATTSIKRTKACPQVKLAEQPTCSYALYASGRLPELLRSMPHYLKEHEECAYTEIESFEDTWEMDLEDREFLRSRAITGWDTSVVPVRLMDGKVEFVDKNALTKRSMESQPTLNSLLQLGIGDWMTKCLKRAGIDISDQSVNQRLARAGSLSGEFATIDLSSASDTIAYQLVKYLLPANWFELLSSARCASTTVGRGKHAVSLRLEKFSAMGNGFTFPLETLIFWALTTASCHRGAVISVYGDDIIVPSRDYDAVSHTLRAAGFTLNEKKSFHSGCFRESCGADYYLGVDIRPCYVDTDVTPMFLFKLHNWYVRSLQDERAERVLNLIPEHLRRFGPDGYGDGHLIGSWEGYRTREMRRNGYAGAFFKTFRLPGRKIKSLYPGDYVTPLYTIYRGDAGKPYDPDREIRINGRTMHIIVENCRAGTPLDMDVYETPSGDHVCRPIYDAPGQQSPTDAEYEEVSIYTLHR